MQSVELTQEQWAAIERLRHEDVNRLRLTHHGDPSMTTVIDQIECRARTSKKLASTLSTHPLFIFPSVLSAEQCTSDSLAFFHASLIPVGAGVLDMTCGLGIDAIHLATKAACVEAYEINEFTASCVRHNVAAAAIENLKIFCGDSVKRLETLDNDSFDCIFIDPARRGAYGKRLFALADCEPDVTALLPRMLEVAPLLIIKASPMLDIAHTISELGHNVSRVIAVGDRRECKELIIICERKDTVSPVLRAVTLSGETISGEWEFTRNEENNAAAIYGLPDAGDYLYEPYPATLKSGGFKSLSSRFKVKKIAPNSHLYSSQSILDDFPGERFRILEVAPFSKKTMRKLKDRYERLDISVRNFPMKPEEISAKLKIKGGGTERLFATRDANDKSIVIVATKD